MKTKFKRFLENNKLIFLAFAIPIVLVIVGLAATGIYPFGSQQILVIDMYHQYLPFLSELQDKLQNGESLFYTWNGAGGSNFWNLIAYYGASPLNLLLVLFPGRLIVEAVTIVLLIKIGLAGAFMCVFLRETYKKCDMGTVAFSTLYALCAFVMGYYWCIMWMDAVLLLPLVVMGLNRIIKGGNPVLYCVALGLTVFTSYYIAIMVCIFIMFYYPVNYFIHVKGAGRRHCLVTTAKAVGYSGIGVGMAALMLLPTYKSMQNTYYISSDMPEAWTFYNSPMDVLNQLMPFSQLTYREGMPNIYCGLLVVILLVFYIVDKNIKLREKSLNIAFLLFLFLSLNINKLDFIWHGFHFPNQLPFRYSFIVSFILIGMAYKAFLHIDSVKTNAIWGTMAGILAWYVLAERLLSEKIDDVNIFFYLGVAILICYVVIMVCYKKGYLDKEQLVVLIALVVIVEMGCNVKVSFDKVGNSDRDYYFQNYESIRTLVEEVDDEMARVELDESFILNTPALYHYKGLSQFSSSINANATYLMEAIGLEGEQGKNRYNYVQTNPVTNAMLNVKYLIGTSWPVEDSDFVEVTSEGDSYLYQSKYPLGLGYMTSNSIWSWDVDLDNPFHVLDDYVRAATDNEYSYVFNEIEATDVYANNMDIFENGDQSWTTEANSDSSVGSVELTYTAEATEKYYVFIEAGSLESITVYDDRTGEEQTLREDCGAIVNVGEMNEGQTFTINLTYESGGSGDIVAHVASLDYEVWDAAYEMLSSNTMAVDKWSETSIEGTVTADEEGVLVTSIPYEEGWSLKVDGIDRELDQLAGGEFIAVGLSEGTHQIELNFTPPGFIGGLIITTISILALIVIVRWGDKILLLIRRRNEGDAKDDNLSADEPMSDDLSADEPKLASQPEVYQEPSESHPKESDYNIEERDYYPQ